MELTGVGTTASLAAPRSPSLGSDRDLLIRPDSNLDLSIEAIRCATIPFGILSFASNAPDKFKASLSDGDDPLRLEDLLDVFDDDLLEDELFFDTLTDPPCNDVSPLGELPAIRIGGAADNCLAGIAAIADDMARLDEASPGRAGLVECSSFVVLIADDDLRSEDRYLSFELGRSDDDPPRRCRFQDAIVESMLLVLGYTWLPTGLDTKGVE